MERLSRRKGGLFVSRAAASIDGVNGVKGRGDNLRSVGAAAALLSEAALRLSLTRPRDDAVAGQLGELSLMLGRVSGRVRQVRARAIKLRHG